MGTGHSRRDVIGATGGLVSAGFAGCLGSEEQRASDDAGTEIVVGSKNFTENILLGYLSYEVIRENTGLRVIDETNYGNARDTFEGLLDREIHTYWDYTGTMRLVNEPRHEEPIEGPERQYKQLTAEMEQVHEMRILDRTAFENRYVFFTSPAFAAKTGVQEISDLAAFVNDGNYDFSVAIESDFADRNDGWPALTEYYGFEEQHLRKWTSRGGLIVVDPGLGYDEYRFGGADIALGYSTNAQLQELNVRFVEDDQGFWPHYFLVPVIAGEKATDPVVRELNKLPGALGSAETMRELNARVDIDDESPQQVARSFLRNAGII